MPGRGLHQQGVRYLGRLPGRQVVHLRLLPRQRPAGAAARSVQDLGRLQARQHLLPEHLPALPAARRWRWWRRRRRLADPVRPRRKLSGWEEVPIRSRLPLSVAVEQHEALDLREARLHEGLFEAAALQDADLRHADLCMARLGGANLRGSRLQGADLSLADLRAADLRNADLRGALLEGADLREADLEGADLEGATLDGARVAGAKGIAADRLAALAARETMAEIRAEAAFRAGRGAHGQGRLGLAEQRYRRAAAWLPELGAVHWARAAVQLERGDADAACAALQDAVRVDPDADRARVGLRALQLLAEAQGAPPDAIEWASTQREPAPDSTVAQLLARADAAKQAAEDGGVEDGGVDDAGAEPHAAGLAAIAVFDEVLQDDPVLRFVRDALETPRRPRGRPLDAASQLADPEFRAAEREALDALLRERGHDAATLQSALVRALGIGAMDLAARAEQRLVRAEPEARLWGLALRELDTTAEAITTLVRTRRGRLGDVRSIGWLALGAHGPTARVETDQGVYFAKRYHGASRSAAAVAFAHRVQRAARAVGLGAPIPLGDAGGDDLLVFGADVLALYDARPGRTVGDDDLRTDEATLLGVTLARLHDGLADLAAGGARPAGGLRVGTRLLRSPSPGAAFEMRVATSREAALWYERSGLRSALQGRLGAVAARLQPWLPGLRPALCHGDFGAGNVLCAEDGSVSVLDWDLCELDVAAWDLARTLDRAALHWPAEAADPVELRRAIGRAIIDGYTSVRPLRDAERQVLPTLVAASRTDLDAGVLAMLAPHDPDAATMVGERLLRRLDRAAAGAPEIDAALGAG
ncbi:MAG: pentapeptide repeat-containing protein [Deltaproteobacteria bacterium]|nr:pentapeptide repeat-containing protein [Deltaproteobacteria bacterium]